MSMTVYDLEKTVNSGLAAKVKYLKLTLVNFLSG